MATSKQSTLAQLPTQSRRKTGSGHPAKSSWLDSTMDGTNLVLATITQVASVAPVPYLKQAAGATLMILNIIQRIKDNRGAFELLGEDAANLIISIHISYREAPDPDNWLTPGLEETLVQLTKTLEEIRAFALEKDDREMISRVIHNKSDGNVIQDFRKRLDSAVAFFGIQSHLNINDKLLEIAKAQNPERKKTQQRVNVPAETPCTSSSEDHHATSSGVKIKPSGQLRIDHGKTQSTTKKPDAKESREEKAKRLEFLRLRAEKQERERQEDERRAILSRLQAEKKQREEEERRRIKAEAARIARRNEKRRPPPPVVEPDSDEEEEGEESEEENEAAVEVPSTDEAESSTEEESESEPEVPAKAPKKPKRRAEQPGFPNMQYGGSQVPGQYLDPQMYNQPLGYTLAGFFEQSLQQALGRGAPTSFVMNSNNSTGNQYKNVSNNNSRTYHKKPSRKSSHV